MLFGGYGIVKAIGENHLRGRADLVQSNLQDVIGVEALTKEEEEKWQVGWVKYKDTIYEYNEEIITFLIMGIDKDSDAIEVAEGTNGGQADALFLTVLNPVGKSIKVIGINRNTMADVDIYDGQGKYVATTKSQIAVQHGFGNGVEESCKYQEKAVENLFFQLPIHGYAAINMSAIAAINDAVGGVEVTVLEDLTAISDNFTTGAKVHLMGENAFRYVKYRDTDVFGSADMRLERQKQYLTSFIVKAKQLVKKEPSVVMDLYQAIRRQMVTDITLDEAVYLASVFADYSFGENSFYTLKGETVMGEQYEEFYPDEEALYEMILDLFYEKVE